ncbi:MAG: histidine phosphatase family protein [Planctomycetes bacterium]|nr:histidine phosphatase family protein [Planctomycetota bacterium]
MRLIVIRHAEAVDRDAWTGNDEDRPLTKAGGQIAKSTFKAARRLGHKGTEIWTSPWLRARATAELLSAIWELPLREVPWLTSGAMSAKDRAERLHASPVPVLVGHEPDLGELIGYLVGAKSLPLAKGGMAILAGDPGPAGMNLRCLISPKTVASLSER